MTINRLIWLDNGYKSGYVIIQDKNHIPPPRKPRGFSRQSYRSLTGKRQRHSERITCRRPLQWTWFLNVWDNVPVNLKYVCQQYFTCMCFLGFIRYNKTFIACGFRKYENFPHQHAINVYYVHCIKFQVRLQLAQLNVRFGNSLTCGRHLYDWIISLWRESKSIKLVYSRHFFYWSACYKPGKCTVMYMCVGRIDFACFYDFSVTF